MDSLKKQRKRYCGVARCPNEMGTDDKNIAMFKAPAIGNDLRDQWIASIEANTNAAQKSFYFFVCERHFEPSLITKKKDRNVLSKNAIPTIFSYSESTCDSENSTNENIEQNSLMKKILDLEIDLMRAKDRIKYLEDKLEEKSDDLAGARKEANNFKKKNEQLINLPTIHSGSLSFGFIYGFGTKQIWEKYEKSGIETLYEYWYTHIKTTAKYTTDRWKCQISNQGWANHNIFCTLPYILYVYEECRKYCDLPNLAQPSYKIVSICQDPEKRTIVECLLNGIEKGAKYNETIRMFSLNMRYLSPRGYEYLRKKFSDNLPHSATIRKWFSFSNAGTNAGFIGAALQTLEKLVQEFRANNNTLYVSIAFDEMAIRGLVQWLHHKKKFSGFINYGTKVCSNEPLPIATNALVVMLNGINFKATIPIAYYFVTSLIAEEKAIMIASILRTLTNIGIRVLSVTSDGLVTNFAAYDILGASFDSDNIVPYFINADDGNKVYVFHDPPHMVKLIRNCLGDEKILLDRNKRPIEWKYIERLYRSTQKGPRSHKLTKQHIDWKTSAMKVGLATQTISSSVAQSIEKLNASGLRQFEDSEGTVEFLKRFNNTFDIFNSDQDVVDNIYKTPINIESKARLFEFMTDMTEYIDGLSIRGKKITKSQRSTGFIGFKSNIIALKMITEEFVDTNLITKLRTVSIQQDYVESFFGRMRSGNGSNTNPSVHQFSANFKRTLVNKELTCSALSNCVDRLDILTVSSGQGNQQTRPAEVDLIMTINEAHAIENVDHGEHEGEELELLFDELVGESGESTNMALEYLGIANIAGKIEGIIEKNKRFHCDDCAFIFEQNQKIDPDFFVNQKKIMLPCQSTTEICKISNLVMSKYLNIVHVSAFDYSFLFNEVKSKLLVQNFFVDTNFAHNFSHRENIVEYIVEEFIRIRAVERAREITLSQHKSLIRSAKTHDIHFAGQ